MIYIVREETVEEVIDVLRYREGKKRVLRFSEFGFMFGGSRERHCFPMFFACFFLTKVGTFLIFVNERELREENSVDTVLIE